MDRSHQVSASGCEWVRLGLGASKVVLRPRGMGEIDRMVNHVKEERRRDYVLIFLCCLFLSLYPFNIFVLSFSFLFYPFLLPPLSLFFRPLAFGQSSSFSEEMFRQGDEEKRLQLKVSPNMDRTAGYVSPWLNFTTSPHVRLKCECILVCHRYALDSV